MYNITFLASAEKELEALPNVEVLRIIQKIDGLSVNPKPPGVKKLTAKFDLFRIRSGNYRIIYSILKNELVIEIIRIRHRKEVYRKR